jgi:hypothetical protein
MEVAGVVAIPGVDSRDSRESFEDPVLVVDEGLFRVCRAIALLPSSCNGANGIYAGLLESDGGVKVNDAQTPSRPDLRARKVPVGIERQFLPTEPTGHG